MRKSASSFCAPSSQETTLGFCYLAFQMILLPGILTWGNRRLTTPLNSAELNFVFYLLNFLAVILIFHDFLGRSAGQIRQHPAYFCQAVILGLAAYYACTYTIDYVVSLLSPGFANYNDGSIAAMKQANAFLMLIGTVVLVPPAEECFYRGLIFRNLYRKSPAAAYIVSIVIFACIHVLGYIGVYSPLDLALAVLQYLPAGLCLAWSYVKGQSIFAPILIHAWINLSAMQQLR